MKRLLPYIFLIVSVTSSFGQSTNISTFLLGTKEKADHFYDARAYRNALEIYLRIADKNKSDADVKEKIASCYLKLNNTIDSEFWYRSLAKEPDVRPDLQLKFAQVLCMNKKYDEALRVLKHIDKKRTDSAQVSRQIQFIENIDYYLRDSLMYTIGNTQKINTPHSEFGATYFKHDKIVFSSTRDFDQFIKHKSLSSPSEYESLTNLFVVEQTIAVDFGEVKLFKSNELKTSFHDGPIVFYDRYRKAAFTRTNFANGKGVADATGTVNLKLYLADVGPLGLYNIKPFPFNDDGYSVGHATFNHDGTKLYFASTHPMGLGGSDIYYSALQNGEWTEPVNVGPEINSTGDELYPHLENDSILFFTSNGHGGFGGLDIYISYYKRGKFWPAQNLGYSVNSSHDDFSLITDSTGRVGFFASNRPGGKGDDDIYRFIATKYFLQGQTRDRNNITVIVPKTKITIKDEFGNVLDSTRSDHDGNFHIDLPFEKDITITAEKEGYEILEDIGFSTRGLHFGVDSLLIPMWKHSLFAKGRIFSNETQDLLPGSVVLRKDLTTNQTDTVVVSQNGEYVFLVLPNHKYRIEAKKEGFITAGFNLDTHNLYEGELLNDIVLEEIYIEKAVPLFDLNKSNIRPEAFRQLDKVVRTLKKYSSTTLNIGAHADSRGSKEYNKRLSEKRAATVVDYFVSKGIARSRIESHAFGEELILNRCSDGVECSEEDHSLNRRVEIKVQNTPIE